jgi:hypothetical protein
VFFRVLQEVNGVVAHEDSKTYLVWIGVVTADFKEFVDLLA